MICDKCSHNCFVEVTEEVAKIFDEEPKCVIVRSKFMKCEKCGNAQFTEEQDRDLDFWITAKRNQMG